MKKIILFSTIISIMLLAGCQIDRPIPEITQESQSTTTNLTLDVTKNINQK